jgi:hypothetical protein
MNPFEPEGVYRLTEMQLDRFVTQVAIGYPGPCEGQELIDKLHFIERHHQDSSKEDLRKLADYPKKVHISKEQSRFEPQFMWFLDSLSGGFLYGLRCSATARHLVCNIWGL